MHRGEVAALNATMSERILDSPAQPLREGRYALRVLRSTGRRSGVQRSTPLGVVRHQGALYVVSPDARRAWVGNLRADPRCELVSREGAEQYAAVPVEAFEAVAVVGVYLHAVTQPWALRAFPVDPHATPEQILAHLGKMAVLRLDPGAPR